MTLSSLMPTAASTMAPRTDALFLTLTGVACFIALTLTVIAVTFCIRYRRGSKASRAGAPDHANGLEWTWTLAPLAAFLALFGWAAHDYSLLVRPPADAAEIFVVAKQWVWTVEHANGRREIDELHVPVGKPVRLLMASQDVVHSFYVPAFRVKQDVVPGRYTSLWFTPTRTGTFHLLCAEYCGTDHASMGGGVVVMRQEDYAAWLAGGARQATLRSQGQALFRERGCIGCHDARSTVHAPDLHGVFGRRVFLQDGRMVVADETYLHDSIVLPAKDVVAGYAPIMPSFEGTLDEEEIAALIQYLHDSDATPAGDLPP